MKYNEIDIYDNGSMHTMNTGEVQVTVLRGDEHYDVYHLVLTNSRGEELIVTDKELRMMLFIIKQLGLPPRDKGHVPTKVSGRRGDDGGDLLLAAMMGGALL